MPIKTRCPICKKPSVAEFRPFCSRACRDRDFLNWADERYTVPVAVEEANMPDGEED